VSCQVAALVFLASAGPSVQSAPPAGATAASRARRPALRRSIWPGAVTVSPRPAPGSDGAPLRTTLFLEIEAGEDAAGEPDPIELRSVNVSLSWGAQSRELVRAGAFTPGTTGRIHPAGPSSNPLQPLDPLALYLVPDGELPPRTSCQVRIEATSRSGLALGRDGHVAFTTRAARDDAPALLRGDAARTVRFEQRVFSGLLKPSFDTSELFGQVESYELLHAIEGPPPRPAAGSLQRDWPLCGDYWTNWIFDGDPNLVREKETRLVTAIGDGAAGELVLRTADLPERELYGIEADRPLAPDFPVGCKVLVVDAKESREAEVVAVDEAARTVRVRADPPPRRATDWLVPAAPRFPPDAPQTPGHFAQPAAWLKKLRPCGTPACWFERLDHEWDLVHGRFGRRLVVCFDRVPADLSLLGVPGRCSTFKDPVEWHDFVRTVTARLIGRYGRACLGFHWSIFNEPDLRPYFWEEDDEALFAAYDLAADAILRAFEEHGLPSEQVKVGGLELGALAAQPQLLETFLEHCSRGLNFALREPRLDGRRSRRVEALAADHDGRGSPCDFVSLHEYKHAAFAIEQLQWARRRALEIDPLHFAGLAVVSFETDPDWNPTRDPATRAMFLGNGFWPAWAADWTRRAIAAAFADPAFASHEALLTVWPVERNLAGIPTITTLLDRLDPDGTTTPVTVPKDILHFLTFLGWMGTDYFLLEGPEGVGGFGAAAGDELALLVVAHDPLDPENRDARSRPVQVALAHVPFAEGVVEAFALDADHGSVWPHARALLDGPAREGFTPEEVAALQRAARLEPLAPTQPLRIVDGLLELAVELPANGLRFFRVRRGAR